MNLTQKLPINNKPVEHFIETIQLLLVESNGTNKGEIQKWLDDDNKIAKKGYNALKKEQEISTIRSLKGSQKLNSFFYVPALARNTTEEEVGLLKLFSDKNESSILILGRLGQGKSMLLRYLQFLALNIGKSLPIFIELRKIKEDETIELVCLNKINSLGLECSQKLFNHLLNSGRLTIFLDGFDETSFNRRDYFCDAISELSNKATPNKVFVTSRFNTEIEQIAGLSSYKIKPLSNEDHPKFISKLINDEEKSKEIVKKIDEAKAFDPSVLDTPLLLTWFIMVFELRRKIPKTKIGFYEELFRTILSRHDGLKLSFDRQSKSGLLDNEIEIVLYAFCYLTSKDNKRDFVYREIIEYIQRALNASEMKSVKSDDYLYDLTNITCLIVKDGLTYDFIHSTIQSYFSACFIKGRNEAIAKTFYANADIDRDKWTDELSFLFDLDSYRFYKFMVIPTISKLSDKSQTKIIRDKCIDTLSLGALKDIYQNACLLYDYDDKKLTYFTTVYIPSHSHTCHLVINDGNLDVCETDERLEKFVNFVYEQKPEFRALADSLALKPENKRLPIRLVEILEKTSLMNLFEHAFQEWTVECFNRKISVALDKINAEEMKAGLF